VSRVSHLRVAPRLVFGANEIRWTRQIAQSIHVNTLHTDEKRNLREECMKTPGVPEVVLKVSSRHKQSCWLFGRVAQI
jgi:hypothetical protein